MKLRYFVFSILAIFFAHPAKAVTYGTCPGTVAYLAIAGNSLPNGCVFVDYATGADTNTGLDEAHPLKHSPFMKGTVTGGDGGCVSTCATIQAASLVGVGVVLKGGVIWPVAAMPWTWTAKGSGSTRSGSATTPYGCAGSGCAVVTIDTAWNLGQVNSIRPDEDWGGCASGGATVGITGGGGTGATATATTIGGGSSFGDGGFYVGFYTVTSSGSGFTSNPTVTVTCSGARNLKAVADIQRAIIDGGSVGGFVWTAAQGGNLVQGSNANFTSWDGLEVRNTKFDVPGNISFDMFHLDNANFSTARNIYAHNLLNNVAHGTSSGDSASMIVGSFNSGGTGSEIVGSYAFNGEPSYICLTSTTYCTFSKSAVMQGTAVHDNKFAFGVWMVSGTYYIYNNDVWGNMASDEGGHTNMFYEAQVGGPTDIVYIHDNIFHDNDHGSSSQITQGNGVTWYFWNNICWLCGAGGSVFGIDAVSSTGATRSDMYWWNNSFATLGGTSSCVNVGSSIPNAAALNVHFYNNHCITTGGSPWWGVLGSVWPNTVNNVTPTSAGNAQTIPTSANVVQTPSAAVTDGYIISSSAISTLSSVGMLASSGGDATVIFSGQNLTNSGVWGPGCTGKLAGLCTSYSGPSEQLASQLRSASSAWEGGAGQFNSSGSTVATPTFSPVAGTYTGTQFVTISTVTGGATICYTTDGSTPTEVANACSGGTTQTYTSPVTVASSLTIKALGTLSGSTDSAVGSAAYTINVSTTTNVQVGVSVVKGSTVQP